MQVILTNDVDHLGYANDVVDVRRGYWRNFLQPRGLAATATASHMRELTAAMERRRNVEARDKGEADELKLLIDRTEITIAAHAGPQGKLYGSVTTAEIARVLEATRKLRVDSRKIQVSEPLKALGTFKVPVDLGHGVKAELTVEVVELQLSETELARLDTARKAQEESDVLKAEAAAAADAAPSGSAVEGDEAAAAEGDEAAADGDDAVAAEGAASEEVDADAASAS